MVKLKLAYFGSPDFSASFLEKILTDTEIPIEIKAVVTQQDKPVGRKKIVTASPVKDVAIKRSTPVFRNSIEMPSVDLALLFAYGEVVPKEILKKSKYGFWNIHPSLLPLYRGPSPVATPLVEGATETGVTLMQMDEEVDHGPIIAQVKTEITPKERRPELTLRLANLGYELFKKTLNNFYSSSERSESRSSSRQARTIKLTPQDHGKATYTKLLTKQDGFISIRNLKFEIRNSPEKLFNRFRGLYPWPGIWTLLRLEDSHSTKVSRDKSERQGKKVEKRFKITDMDLEDGKLIIKKVQLEGKNEVDYPTFSKAYGITF